MTAPQSEEVEVEDPMDKALKEIYYNAQDSRSYGWVDKHFGCAKKTAVQKVTRGRVKQFLADQQSYFLLKPDRRHCKRNPTYVKVINAQWQPDMAEMQSLCGDNNGQKFILTVMDIFRKRACAIPIKNKSG